MGFPFVPVSLAVFTHFDILVFIEALGDNLSVVLNTF